MVTPFSGDYMTKVNFSVFIISFLVFAIFQVINGEQILGPITFGR